MEQNKCNKCGRPIQYATEPKCNYCDSCMSEYCGCKLGRIKEIEPTCDSTAVIPSITVESVEGITNLANCLVHVNDINTTFYVDDKHRVMITWAGPVDIPGYDMENNPNGYRDQIITDIEKGIAVIYDKHGKGYTFGIYDSLDSDGAVTQAINNKLDEMAANGTLEEIISDYIGEPIFGFDTVADMKASTTLKAGDRARTLGFYSVNDGGGALYKITSTGTANEMDVIAVGDLYANLVNNATVRIKQFGATGDGQTDETTIIQRALDYTSDQQCELLINDGVYMVDAETSVFPKSNSTITFVNSSIKALPTNNDHYNVLLFRAVHDITLNNPVILGERNEHTGSGGEFGYCVYMSGSCKDITFNNATFAEAWGDGLIMFAEQEASVWKYPEYIVFNGMTNVYDCRRQGVSIIAGEHIIFDTLYCKDINGTLPMSGIDIETEGLTWNVGDIHINYLKTEGTVKSFSFRNKGDIVGNISVDRIEHTKPITQTSGAYQIYSNPVTIFFDHYSTDSAQYSINIGDIYTDYGDFTIKNAYLGATPTVHINNIYSKEKVFIYDADANSSRGIINIQYDKQCSLTNYLGGIYIDNIIIEHASEIQDRDINIRYFSVYYDFGDNSSKVFKDVIINCKLIEADDHLKFTSPMPTSNVVFDNATINVNMPDEYIRSAGGVNTSKVIGGIEELYYLPTDSTGTNRLLILRPTNAFIKLKVYAKGGNQIRVNTAYNTTYFDEVYENGAAITPDANNNYDATAQSGFTIYNITTKDKKIYIEIV